MTVRWRVATVWSQKWFIFRALSLPTAMDLLEQGGVGEGVVFGALRTSLYQLPLFKLPLPQLHYGSLDDEACDQQ